MEFLKNIAHNTIDTLLNDPTTEEETQQSDRMGGAISTNASMPQQATVKTRTTYDPATNSLDDFKSQNFDISLGHLNPSKLVELGSGEWTLTTSVFGEILKFSFPRDFYPNTSFPARGPTRYFNYIRTGFHFEININAAAGVAGGAIALWAPKGLDITGRDQNSLFMLDHVEINVDANSSGTLKIPYMNVENYAETDSDDLGNLYIIALTPLTAPASVTPTVTVTVFGAMYDMDLQNPRVQGPPRSRIDIAEGPGAMNLANGDALERAQSIALNGEQVQFDSKTAGNSKSIESLRTLTKVKNIINETRFDWNVSNPIGSQLLAYNLFSNDVPLFGMLANGYRLWRGSLIFGVQIYATKFNKGRIRMAFYPNANTDFTNQQANNAIYTVHELGLNTGAELVVPFSSKNWLRSTSFTTLLGRLKIFVVNRLQANVNAPNIVKAFVTLRFGEDVEFLAPIDRGVKYQGEGDIQDAVVEETSSAAAAAAGVTTPENVGGSPAAETPAPKMLAGKITHIKPVRDDHMKLSNLFGRAMYMGQFEIKETVGSIELRPPNMGHGALMKLFLYFTGEITFSIRNKDIDAIYVSHAYDDGAATTSFSGMASMGMLVVPPNSMMSFKVPYYSGTPLRTVTNGQGPPTFGSLFFKGENNDIGGKPSVTIWMSLNDPKFYRPCPVPNILSTNQADDGDDVDGHLKLALNARVLPISSFGFEMILESNKLDRTIRNTTLVKEKTIQPGKCEVVSTSRKEMRKTVWKNTGYSTIKGTLSCEHGCVRSFSIQPGDHKSMVACWNHMEDDQLLVMTTKSDKFLSYERRSTASSERLLQEGIESNPGPVDASHTKREFVELFSNSDDIQLSDDITIWAIEDEFGGRHGLRFIKGDQTLDLWLETSRMNMPMIRIPTPGIFWKQTQQLDTLKYDATSVSSLPPIQCAHHAALAIKSFFGHLPTKVTRSWLTMLAIRSLCGDLKDQGFGDLMEMLTSFLDAKLKSMVIQVISPTIKQVRLLLRGLVKAIIYAAMIATNPKPSVVAMVITLIGLDVEDMEGKNDVIKEVFEAVTHGDYRLAMYSIHKFIIRNSGMTMAEEAVETLTRSFRKLMQPSNQGLSDNIKNFNLATMACKSFDWWIGTFQKLIAKLKEYFSPTHKAQALTIMEAGRDAILSTLTKVDRYLVRVNSATTFSLEDKKEAVDLLNDLNDIKYVARTAESYPIVNQLCSLSEKLTRHSQRPVSNGDIIRMEPIGVLLYGPPGQGKTAFSLALCRQIQEELDLVKPGVYNQNSVDEFMTGYHGQFFHIIDDFLQMRDDEDAKSMCQMISGVPWKPNMASLEEKGIDYTSKVVIATTNRNTLDPHNMTDPGALKRRFKFAVEVIAADDYRDKDGKLDTESAESAGAVYNGECWRCSSSAFGAWGRVNLKTLAALIATEYKKRMVVVQNMGERLNALKDQADDDDEDDVEEKLKVMYLRLAGASCDEVIFESMAPAKGPIVLTPSEKMLCWFNKCLKSAQDAWEKIKNWCVAIFGLCGFLSGLFGMYSLFRPQADVSWDSTLPEDQQVEITMYGDQARAYSGHRELPKVVKNSKVIVRTPKTIAKPGHGKEQGPIDEFPHLLDRCGYIESKPGKYTYFVGLEHKTFIVFGHSIEMGLLTGDLYYNGLHCKLDGTVELIVTPYYTENAAIDVVSVTIPTLPFQFKRTTHLIRAPTDTKQDGWMISRAKHAYAMREVHNIQYSGLYTSEDHSGVVAMKDAALRYVAKTGPGDCGSIVIQKQGSNWYIVGMHVCGSPAGIAYGVSLGSVFKDEGVVVDKRPLDRPIWTPTQTKIRKSPLYGIFPVTHEPAPLHPKDRRIEVPVEQLVKKCAEKYRVNKFDPCPNIFTEAKQHLTKKLFGAIGMSQEVRTWAEAANGVGGSNPIDMRTSAGPVYTQQHIKKEDLFERTGGILVPTVDFARECDEKIAKLKNQGEIGTIFGAVLKDELIKVEKIKEGKSRCIEACGVDYVMVYRKIMGEIYEKIYNTPATATTVAVGLNPILDFHGLYHSLQGQLVAVDYSRYDGSLSEELMRHAVDVLASCHEDPELVKRLHEPVIISRHWVTDEEWKVLGGMPSGSPCTSVLNSLCNSLVMYSSLYASGATDLDEITIATYGDDVIASLGDNECDLDITTTYIKEWFGMEATSSDKLSTNITVSRADATFLKRRFVWFPGTQFVTGQLDLNSMKSKIMWCHGKDQFVQQLESFMDELVLHGGEEYEKVRRECLPRLEDLNIYFTPYQERRRMVYNRIFV